MTLLCGRYEGVDQRVLEAHAIEEISLGDFVLSGGEPAAMALIDACVRLLPGVIGAEASLGEESFEGGLLGISPLHAAGGMGRPARAGGSACPAITNGSGIGGAPQAERVTRERRPDLWQRYAAGQK